MVYWATGVGVREPHRQRYRIEVQRNVAKPDGANHGRRSTDCSLQNQPRHAFSVHGHHQPIHDVPPPQRET